MVNKHNSDLYNLIQAVPRTDTDLIIKPGTLVIDTRPAALFRKGHIQGAINIQEGTSFTACLKAIVREEEPFYLVAADTASRERLIKTAANAGLAEQITTALVFIDQDEEESDVLDLEDFKARPEAYTILDVRNQEEIKQMPLFTYAVEIPLRELRVRLWETKSDKPLVVHSGGGYRSAVASSYLKAALVTKTVYDLGEAVKFFFKK